MQDFEIIVEVFHVQNRHQVQPPSFVNFVSLSNLKLFDLQIVQLYIEINKAQPVLEIDVPDVIATSKKIIIDQACLALNKVCCFFLKIRVHCVFRN